MTVLRPKPRLPPVTSAILVVEVVEFSAGIVAPVQVAPIQDTPPLPRIELPKLRHFLPIPAVAAQQAA